jgi:hypothetical protein
LRGAELGHLGAEPLNLARQQRAAEGAATRPAGRIPPFDGGGDGRLGLLGPAVQSGVFGVQAGYMTLCELD